MDRTAEDSSFSDLDDLANTFSKVMQGKGPMKIFGNCKSQIRRSLLKNPGTQICVFDKQLFTDTARSTTDIREGGGGTGGMEIQVPDDSHTRAKVKVTEEKLGEIPDHIPTKEGGGWKKLGEIPDDIPTKEGEGWKKLGEIRDDISTTEEGWKEQRKPKGKGKVTEEELGGPKHKPKVERLKERDEWYIDGRNQILLRAFWDPKLKWEEKVMDILHVVRCRGFTEYNKKMQFSLPTRFCLHNIAFFDHDKESEDAPWPPIHRIPQPLGNWLYDSVNVLAIRVAQSDRKGPISIYGTVLARDEYDYRCVYLFRRGRDDPQLITRKARTLTLISPIRALAVMDSMFFEFDLKIKGGGDAADEDFSKGVREHNAIRHTKQPTVRSLASCLSTMELVYAPVRSALEAFITINILKGPSAFTSKMVAWTSGSYENRIMLYDSEGEGIRTKLGPGDSITGLVAVPLGEELVLSISLADGVQMQPEECLTFLYASLGDGIQHQPKECLTLTLFIGPDVDERTLEQGPYKIVVKISWKGVVNQPPGCKLWGRPGMWGYIAGRRVLLS